MACTHSGPIPSYSHFLSQLHPNARTIAQKLHRRRADVVEVKFAVYQDSLAVILLSRRSTHLLSRLFVRSRDIDFLNALSLNLVD